MTQRLQVTFRGTWSEELKTGHRIQAGPYLLVASIEDSELVSTLDHKEWAIMVIDGKIVLV